MNSLAWLCGARWASAIVERLGDRVRLPGVGVPRYGRRTYRLGYVGSIGLVLGVGLACETSDRPHTGSNSNWLQPCVADADCGDGDCHCGVCTPACENDADCANLEGGICSHPSEPAAWTQCETRDPSRGICLLACQPGGCPSDLMCVGGSCVNLPLPESEFCAPVAETAAATRLQEELLLEMLQAARRGQSLACGTAPAPLAPQLLVDGRLVCAARVFATDLAATGGDSMIDSAGRSTAERLQLAGYAALEWGEAFAYAPNASTAFDLLATGIDSCPLLVDEVLSEAGVGCTNSTCVVTLAEPMP